MLLLVGRMGEAPRGEESRARHSGLMSDDFSELTEIWICTKIFNFLLQLFTAARSARQFKSNSDPLRKCKRSYHILYLSNLKILLRTSLLQPYFFCVVTVRGAG